MDLAKVEAAQLSWLRAAGAGGRGAEEAAIDALRRCGDTIAAMERNLREIGYPCTRLAKPCSPDLDSRISEIEATLRVTVPPVVIALWHEVGGLAFVDLESYEHVVFWEEQSIFGQEGYCDGVYVDACTEEWAGYIRQEILETMEAGDEDPESTPLIPLSPDGYHKDDISGGDSYGGHPGRSWSPVWQNFSWLEDARPKTAPSGPPDFLSYLRTALLECAGFPGLLGADGFDEVRERVLDCVPIF